MRFRETLRKIFYYGNIMLLCRIFLTSLRVYFARPEKITKLADVTVKAKAGDRQKIVRYTGLCLRLRAGLGFKDTCLTNSVLLARMLRKHGIDAQINFGVRKNEKGKLAGHCWVTVGQEEIKPDWMLVCRYPPVMSV